MSFSTPGLGAAIQIGAGWGPNQTTNYYYDCCFCLYYYILIVVKIKGKLMMRTILKELFQMESGGCKKQDACLIQTATEESELGHSRVVASRTEGDTVPQTKHLYSEVSRPMSHGHVLRSIDVLFFAFSGSHGPALWHLFFLSFPTKEFSVLRAACSLGLPLSLSSMGH